MSKKEIKKSVNENSVINQIDLIPRGKGKKFQDLSKNPVMTRKEAELAGLTLYWRGESCSNGHNSVIYTRDGVCKECYKEYCSGLRDSGSIFKDKFEKKSDRRQIKNKIKETVLASV